MKDYANSKNIYIFFFHTEKSRVDVFKYCREEMYVYLLILFGKMCQKSTVNKCR